MRNKTFGNWLFWFCEGLEFVSGKTKCANVGRKTSFFGAVEK